MRVELQNEEHCRYLRVYHYYRNLILSGQMKSETKLPSIRKGANELRMRICFWQQKVILCPDRRVDIM